MSIRCDDSVSAFTPGSRVGLDPRSGGKSVAVQPIVKAYQASNMGVAGHGQ